ncbi:MAG TPA: hypothetical protein PLU43_12230, partial [Lachnospiraceae bacterium]|nr:hypothetical protein [Lachnospiraceae bacterium]
IGIYSPVTNVLKTSFAMTLGQILAEEEEVLFISLECCSGLTGLLSLNKERDLSDLLYERSVGEARFSLGRFTQRAEGLSIISPVDGVTELQSVKKEEWVKLMRFLLREGSYSKLILDIGNSVNGIIEILQLCGMIYMPYRQDRISMAKLSAFETCIDRYEAAQDLKKKIKKLKMPYFENLEESLVELKYGAFGSFVRTILSK